MATDSPEPIATDTRAPAERHTDVEPSQVSIELEERHKTGQEAIQSGEVSENKTEAEQVGEEEAGHRERRNNSEHRSAKETEQPFSGPRSSFSPHQPAQPARPSTTVRSGADGEYVVTTKKLGESLRFDADNEGSADTSSIPSPQDEGRGVKFKPTMEVINYAASPVDDRSRLEAPPHWHGFPYRPLPYAPVPPPPLRTPLPLPPVIWDSYNNSAGPYYETYRPTQPTGRSPEAPFGQQHSFPGAGPQPLDHSAGRKLPNISTDAISLDTYGAPGPYASLSPGSGSNSYDSDDSAYKEQDTGYFTSPPDSALSQSDFDGGSDFDISDLPDSVTPDDGTMQWSPVYRPSSPCYSDKSGHCTEASLTDTFYARRVELEGEFEEAATRPDPPPDGPSSRSSRRRCRTPPRAQQQQPSTFGTAENHRLKPPRFRENYELKDIMSFLSEEDLAAQFSVLEHSISNPHHQRRRPFYKMQKTKLGRYMEQKADGCPCAPPGTVRIITFRSSKLSPNQARALTRIFNLPEKFWRTVGQIGAYYSSTEYYSRGANGEKEATREMVLLLVGKTIKDSNKSLDSEFPWAVPHFFLRFNPSSVDIFCLNLHRTSCLETRLTNVLSSREEVLGILADPFILYSHILSEWDRLSSEVFWRLRKKLTELETNPNPQETRDNSEHYKSLHNLAKHITQQQNEVAQHSFEIALAVQEDHNALLRKTKLRRRIWRSASASFPEQRLPPRHYHPETNPYIDEDLLRDCQSNTASMLRGLVLNSKLNLSSFGTLKQRVANQINLAFHLTQQRTSDATRTDSIAMMTISMVTLVFLPPTAMATIFSMPFFDVPEDRRGKLFVHPDIWIYAVFTVPITVATVVVYRWWRKRILAAEKPLMEKQKSPDDDDDSQSDGDSDTAVTTSRAESSSVRYRGKPRKWVNNISTATKNVWQTGSSLATRRQRSQEPKSMV